MSLVSALVDLSQAHNDELKPIDVYAIGFEEMVDLDAKNIMNARFVSLSCSESMVSQNFDSIHLLTKYKGISSSHNVQIPQQVLIKRFCEKRSFAGTRIRTHYLPPCVFLPFL